LLPLGAAKFFLRGKQFFCLVRKKYFPYGGAKSLPWGSKKMEGQEEVFLGKENFFAKRPNNLTRQASNPDV